MRFAVRAPCGIALGNSGRVGEVAGVAFLSGNGEDLSMCLKGGARAGGRQGGISDFVGADRSLMRCEFSEFSMNLDGHGIIGIAVAVSTR